MIDALYAYDPRMTAQTWVALGAALLAGIVAVTVPLVTFRMSLRLDQLRWLRDERAKLYSDLIVEAVAEYESIRVVKPDPNRLKELSSPPRERAQLGARVVIFASGPVRAAWTKYDEAILAYPDPEKLNDEERAEAQHAIYEHFEALEVVVRQELGTSDWHLPGRA